MSPFYRMSLLLLESGAAMSYSDTRNAGDGKNYVMLNEVKHLDDRG